LESKIKVPLHLPSLSETGVSGLSRPIFTLACVLGSASFVCLALLGFFGAMETISQGRRGLWLFVHHVRCISWVLSGCMLFVIGIIPLQDLGGEKDPFVTFWERYSVSTPIHLIAAFIFMASNVVSMFLGTVLAFRESRRTHMSKQAKGFIVAWKGLTLLLAFIWWPLMPLLGMIGVVVLCDLSSTATLRQCWLMSLEQTGIGALFQYAFVISLCEHVASYVWDMKHAAILVNPDISLSLFREINTSNYTANHDEFKVDSDLDDLASSDTSL